MAIYTETGQNKNPWQAASKASKQAGEGGEAEVRSRYFMFATCSSDAYTMKSEPERQHAASLTAWDKCVLTHNMLRPALVALLRYPHSNIWEIIPGQDISARQKGRARLQIAELVNFYVRPHPPLNFQWIMPHSTSDFQWRMPHSPLDFQWRMPHSPLDFQWRMPHFPLDFQWRMK